MRRYDMLSSGGLAIRLSAYIGPANVRGPGFLIQKMTRSLPPPKTMQYYNVCHHLRLTAQIRFPLWLHPDPAGGANSALQTH